MLRPCPVADLLLVDALGMRIREMFDDLAAQPLLDVIADAPQPRHAIDRVDASEKRSTWLMIASSSGVLMLPFS